MSPNRVIFRFRQFLCFQKHFNTLTPASITLANRERGASWEGPAAVHHHIIPQRHAHYHRIRRDAWGRGTRTLRASIFQRPCEPSICFCCAFSASCCNKVLLLDHMLQLKLPLLEKRAIYLWVNFLICFLQLSGFPSLGACCFTAPKPLPAHIQGHLSHKMCSPLYTVKSFVKHNLLVCLGLGDFLRMARLE